MNNTPFIMTTLVNGNLRLYFATDTDDDDRVICKLCRKRLKGKRSFNLKKHLKHAHKLEIRPDKRISHLKSQQLPTCSKEVTRKEVKGINFWTYFTNSDRTEKVYCKLCSTNLKSNYGFNLRKHLKLSHNIEIRPDKIISHLKSQQLPICSKEVTRKEVKGVNFWTYFTNSDRAERVTCKLCSKNLNSNNGFNLRKHLKFLHNIEIRLDDKRLSRKRKLQRLHASIETAYVSSKTCENSSSESRPAGSSPTNTQTLDSNGSYTRVTASPTLLDIKEECIQEVIEKGVINTVEQEILFELNSHEKEDNQESTQKFPAPPLIYRCKTVPISRKNGNAIDDPLQCSAYIPSTNGEYESRSKKKKFVDDESTILCGSENFDEWVRRKRILLEIEEIEMRHYKIKLELWEKEQHLNLKCSKFTRDMKIFK